MTHTTGEATNKRGLLPLPSKTDRRQINEKECGCEPSWEPKNFNLTYAPKNRINILLCFNSLYLEIVIKCMLYTFYIFSFTD